LRVLVAERRRFRKPSLGRNFVSLYTPSIQIEQPDIVHCGPMTECCSLFEKLLSEIEILRAATAGEIKLTQCVYGAWQS
jgi:hypothetical protein